MWYPYLLYCPGMTPAPVFSDLQGTPLLFDMSHRNALLWDMDIKNQAAFQKYVDDCLQPDHTWGLAGYLERRDSLLRECPQMVTEQRFYHLGLDVIVPKGARLHAPLPAQVFDTGYEEGHGNYGGYTMLKHEGDQFETFYSFYGHLNPESLLEPGQKLSSGEVFAETGDFHENGNWFYHTHIQVITQKGYEHGYASKGYCTEKDLAVIHELCPSPIPLFRV